MAIDPAGIDAAPPASVTVYAFRWFDTLEGRSVVPAFKATETAVRRRFRGEILPLTGEPVASDELDADGCWRRLPTGWGDLDTH